MMKLHFYLPILSLLINFSCSSDQKFKPTKDMLELSALQDEIVLKIGEKAYYQGDVHGSVGISLIVQVENEKILKLSDTHFAYDHPENSDMPGGDGGTKTFTFEALKAGTTKITIQKDFRGEIEDEFDIKVIIQE